LQSNIQADLKSNHYEEWNSRLTDRTRTSSTVRGKVTRLQQIIDYVNVIVSHIGRKEGGEGNHR